jgi:tetratricopeptide (TPR) repeat protein
MQEWEQLKEEGRKFYQDSQWSKATECYTKAIALNPTAAVLYSNRALCHMQLSDFSRAREDAEIAIRLDPMVVKYYWTLSRALRRLNLHRESAEACIAGLKVDPCDEVLLSRLLEAQQLNTAAGSDEKLGFELEHFLPRSDVFPGETLLPNSESLMRSTLSDLKKRAERGSKAARKYLRALELMQGAAIDAFNGTDSQAVFHKFLEARKLWYVIPAASDVRRKFHEMAKEAAEKDPKNAEALYVILLTEVWRQGGGYENLIPIARTCVTLKPNVAEFHVILGHYHAYAGDYKNAVVSFDRALQLQWNPEVVFNKGRALQAQENRDREAIKVSPNRSKLIHVFSSNCAENHELS